MKSITYIFLSLFIAFTIEAQTISITGNIKDLENNSPIENAKVQIKHLQSGFIDSVFSDAIGNWQYDIVTSVEHESTFLPNNLEVYQNFPNPFNPSTKINFSIPTNENVTILVHDILGQLVDQKSVLLSAGNYVIDWFSKGSAGVYLYTISYGDQSVTRKMIQLDGGNGIGLGEIKTGLTTNHDFVFAIPVVDVEIVITKFGYAADSTITAISGGENFSTHLQTVHSKYTLVDLHNDILEVIIDDPNYHLGTLHTYNHTDIPRLQQGGVDVQFFAIWVRPDSTHYTNYFERALLMRDRFYSELSANPTTIAQATKMQQALELNSQDKIAAVIGVEGGHSIENSIDNLVTLYDAGMRYLTITWNNSTTWAISAKDSRSQTQGLTEFGRQVIRKLDSLGVIIDVSHTGIKTIEDILTETTNPIVATHSGARSVYNHYRNLYDSQILAIANTGGVVGIIFYPWFLNGSSNAAISDVIAHIDYIVNLVGTDYVAIGSDFDGIEVTPLGLEDTSKFPDLTLALLQHGYSETDVAKFLGGNFKRVFEQVCGN
jgi:membrane dipeptidase